MLASLDVVPRLLLTRASVLFLLGTAPLAGCMPARGTVSDTHVAHQDLYKTSNFTYDELFEDVFTLQKESGGAADAEKTARKPLADKLGGGGDGPIDPLIDLVKHKAEELASDKKLRLHLAYEGIDEQGRPEPGKTITVTGKPARGRAIPPNAKELMDAIEQTAKAEAAVFDRYAPMGDKARRRIGHADELLPTVDRDFETSPPEKRDAIKNELMAAKLSLSQIAEGCDKAAMSAVKLLRETSVSFEWAWSNGSASKSSKKGAAATASKDTMSKDATPKDAKDKDKTAAGHSSDGKPHGDSAKPEPKPKADTKPDSKPLKPDAKPEAKPAPAAPAADFNP